MIFSSIFFLISQISFATILLNGNNILSFKKYTVLANGNNKFVLEIEERLLIKRDRPVLNKSISSAKLFPFDNNKFFNRFFIQYIV